MGELEEIKTLLQATLTSITSSMQLHQQMIFQLQQENKELKELILAQRTTKDPLQKEVMNTFRRNKKRLIKNKILESIKSRPLTIPEVKEIIVDHQNYCSKASFYRYLEELKQHDFIHITSQNRIKIKPMIEAV